jgi:acyl-CoA thioester hydrolase
MSDSNGDDIVLSPLPLRERARVRGMVVGQTTTTAPATAPSPQPSPARGEGAKPAEAANPFSIPVRIYYEDTDVGGVVYYANYLRYIERARTEWLRAAGFELDAIQRDLKAVFVVRRVEADYHSPALLGNLITVTAEPTEVGASRLIILQRVTRDDELLFSAVVTLAFIASDLSGPIRMPPAMRAAMKSTLSLATE